MPRWEKKRKLLSEGTCEAIKEGTWDGLGELAGYNEGLCRKEQELCGEGGQMGERVRSLRSQYISKKI